MNVNSKHRKTLEAIFADPVRANIPWDDIEALLVAMGAERYEGNGRGFGFCSTGPGPPFTARIHKRKQTVARWSLSGDLLKQEGKRHDGIQGICGQG